MRVGVVKRIWGGGGEEGSVTHKPYGVGKARKLRARVAAAGLFGGKMSDVAKAGEGEMGVTTRLRRVLSLSTGKGVFVFCPFYGESLIDCAVQC